MLIILIIVLLVVAFFVFIGLLSLNKLIYICGPNQVLIFSGKSRVEGGKRYGYRLIKGGRGIRVPFLEEVNHLELTNMVIDVTAHNAYSRGGIPLTVQGVANVKIAGFEPVLNNAIERFIGKSRQEIMDIAKATLEGSLRGILATLTPEQVNEDKILFAERLVHEVEQDMTNLGFVVDSFKIQNVQDEVHYLDSIGRKKSAEVISRARIAEAQSRADSVVRSAENLEREVRAQVDGQIKIVNADAEKRLAETLSRREALVAEERSKVFSAIAQVQAEIGVQEARIDQVKNQLEADIILPAKAASEAAESKAIADNVAIIEAGIAQADALVAIAKSCEEAGPQAREILLSQKIQPIIEQIVNAIAHTNIQKLTVLSSPTSSGGRVSGDLVANLYRISQQVKEVFGIDLVEKLKGLPNTPPSQENEIPFMDNLE